MSSDARNFSSLSGTSLASSRAWHALACAKHAMFLNCPLNCLLICLLAMIWPAIASAKEPSNLPTVGRLLSTPGQRAVLDQLRANTGKPIPPATNPEDDIVILPTTPQAGPATLEPSPAPSLMLNGFVRRSQGPATVWINQTAQELPRRNSLASGRYQLSTPEGQVVSLKPGQSLVPVRGSQGGSQASQVEEVYGTGQLRIHTSRKPTN